SFRGSRGVLTGEGYPGHRRQCQADVSGHGHACLLQVGRVHPSGGRLHRRGRHGAVAAAAHGAADRGRGRVPDDPYRVDGQQQGDNMMERREVLMLGAGAVVALGLPLPAWSAADDAVMAYTGGSDVLEGGVTLDAPEIAENGNTVPIRVSAEGAEEIRSEEH